jgi:hypothetical protein
VYLTVRKLTAQAEHSSVEDDLRETIHVPRRHGQHRARSSAKIALTDDQHHLTKRDISVSPRRRPAPTAAPVANFRTRNLCIYTAPVNNSEKVRSSVYVSATTSVRSII